jgi:exopolyphosphatase/guanosine-5'-triphosphate,3'-diphosphate pyrophosphatase
MRGFSQQEIDIIALIARYHRKTAPKKNHPEFSRASKEAQKKVSKLTAILRVADSLDRTHATLVRAVRCTINPKTIELRLETDDDPELELWTARRKGDLFEELFGRRLRFAVDAPSEAMSPKGLAKEGDQVVHPTLALKQARDRRPSKSRS